MRVTVGIDMLTYKEHKEEMMNAPAMSNKFKAALELLDDMDCVKALNYAHLMLQLMQKRVDEVQGVV